MDRDMNNGNGSGYDNSNHSSQVMSDLEPPSQMNVTGGDNRFDDQPEPEVDVLGDNEQNENMNVDFVQPPQLDASFAGGNHSPVVPYPSQVEVWFMPPNANIPEMPVILHIVVPSPNSAIQLMGDPFRFNQLFSRSVLRYPSGIHCIYSYLEFFTPGNGPLNGTGPGTIVSIGRVVYVINQCSVCQNHNGQ